MYNIFSNTFYVLIYLERENAIKYYENLHNKHLII